MEKKYFTITELSKSETAKALKINNTIPQLYIANAQALIDNILHPLRVAWGSAINVTSGYRCDALNDAVGGSKTSAHSFALAADLVPANGKIDEFIKFTINWLKQNNIEFDQCIDEMSKGGKKWCHVSLKNRQGQLRKQFLLFRNGVYSNLK